MEAHGHRSGRWRTSLQFPGERKLVVFDQWELEFAEAPDWKPRRGERVVGKLTREGGVVKKRRTIKMTSGADQEEAQVNWDSSPLHWVRVTHLINEKTHKALKES